MAAASSSCARTNVPISVSSVLAIVAASSTWVRVPAAQRGQLGRHRARLRVELTRRHAHRLLELDRLRLGPALGVGEPAEQRLELDAPRRTGRERGVLGAPRVDLGGDHSLGGGDALQETLEPGGLLRAGALEARLGRDHLLERTLVHTLHLRVQRLELGPRDLRQRLELGAMARRRRREFDLEVRPGELHHRLVGFDRARRAGGDDDLARDGAQPLGLFGTRALELRLRRDDLLDRAPPQVLDLGAELFELDPSARGHGFELGAMTRGDGVELDLARAGTGFVAGGAGALGGRRDLQTRAASSTRTWRRPTCSLPMRSRSRRTALALSSTARTTESLAASSASTRDDAARSISASRRSRFCIASTCVSLPSRPGAGAAAEVAGSGRSRGAGGDSSTTGTGAAAGLGAGVAGGGAARAGFFAFGVARAPSCPRRARSGATAPSTRRGDPRRRRRAEPPRRRRWRPRRPGRRAPTGVRIGSVARLRAQHPSEGGLAASPRVFHRRAKSLPARRTTGRGGVQLANVRTSAASSAGFSNGSQCAAPSITSRRASGISAAYVSAWAVGHEAVLRARARSTSAR